MPSTIEARTLSPINSTPRNSPAVEGFEGGEASGKRPPLPVGWESQIKRERDATGAQRETEIRTVSLSTIKARTPSRPETRQRLGDSKATRRQVNDHRRRLAVRRRQRERERDAVGL